jgi:leucyl-tRNA synthetase
LTQELARRIRSWKPYRECRKTGTAEAEIEKAEKLGYDTGLTAAHPFDPNGSSSDGGQFRADGLRHRRHLRCPAHDQRDLDFARKYRLSVTPVVVPSDARSQDFRDRQRGLYRSRHAGQFRFLDGMTVEQAKSKSRRGWKSAASASAPPITACATGWCRASGLGLSHPHDPLRKVRRGAGAEGSIAGASCRR